MVLSSMFFSGRKRKRLRHNFHEVRDFVDHAAHCWGVFQLGNRVDATQTQATHGRTVRFAGADQAHDQLDFDGFLAAVVIVFTLSQDVFNRLAALGSDVGCSAHFRQAVERGANQVVRVRRAGGFRHDVGHAHYFEDCAHGAAGDHAGTRLGGHHHYFRCAVTAGNGVVQGTVLERHLDQVATGFFHCLLHTDGYFFRLALAHADAAIAVTDDGQCGETHDTTTLDHFGHAVDRDHFFAHAIIRLVALHFSLHFCHDDYP